MRRCGLIAPSLWRRLNGIRCVGRTSGPTDLVSKIQPQFKVCHANFRLTTLGFAPLTEGERGPYASVFYDRVEALAKRGDFSQALILGHGVAHEIGHLLLRTMAHSRTGSCARTGVGRTCNGPSWVNCFSRASRAF